jgi:antitoxin HicB
MFYPAVLTRDGDGWMVAFPDIPEALTSGATREEALEMAKDALKTAMEFYFEERRPVPLPSKVTRGQDAVELEPSVAAKVLLLNEIVKQNVRPTDLARKLGTTPQEVNRLMDLRHATKIDSINAAMHAIGKRLEVRAVAA